MKSILYAYLFLCGLSITAVPALGDTATTAAPQNGPQSSGWCAQNQQECKEKMEKFKKLCQQDPQKCEAIKKRYRAKIEAYCKQNPNNQRCEKLKPTQQHGTDNKANDNNNPPPGV